MASITSLGYRLYIQDSLFLPLGFDINQGADDKGIFEVDDIEVGDSSRGHGGHAIHWQKPASIYKVRINVFAEGLDDNALSLLLKAYTFTSGRSVPLVGLSNQGRDGSITLTRYDLAGISPPVVFYNGIITMGSPASSSDISGKIPTKTYHFNFGEMR
jgi:hypothetical protein